MLVKGFPAGSFAANCYVAAPEPGEECVIIDPGEDAAAGIDDLVREFRLKPVAVLLTHGHLDHVWSVAPVCGARDIPAYIHPDDRKLLTDPARGFSLGAGQELFGGLTLAEPGDVRALEDGAVLRLAGLEIRVEHAPGHTPGSVVFRLPPADGARSPGPISSGPVSSGPVSSGPVSSGPVSSGPMFSGDLLFAGSIGRSDLPGGDYRTIMESLARVCLPLPDTTVVLPGHGPQTTIGAERATNPFLVPLAGAGERGVSRGL